MEIRMTLRENLIAALDGRQPAWIPYTINQEFVTDDPAWSSRFPRTCRRTGAMQFRSCWRR
jgi:hypothetical protein